MFEWFLLLVRMLELGWKASIEHITYVSDVIGIVLVPRLAGENASTLGVLSANFEECYGSWQALDGFCDAVPLILL